MEKIEKFHLSLRSENELILTSAHTFNSAVNAQTMDRNGVIYAIFVKYQLMQSTNTNECTC